MDDLFASVSVNQEAPDGENFSDGNVSSLPVLWWLGILIALVIIRVAYELME